MGASDGGASQWWVNAAFACAPAILAEALQGCPLYGRLMQRGGSLPFGEGAAEWTPAVTTPTGGALGVQIIRRF